MKRIELVDAMKTVVEGIEKSLEGMDYALFEDGWVRSFSDYISVSYPLNTGLRCAVKAKEFYQLVSLMEGEDLELVEDDQFITITGGGTTAKLVKMEAERLAAFKVKILSLQTDGLIWFAIPQEFNDAADFCRLSAGKEGRLEGVGFAGTHILSSDNLMASHYSGNVDLGNFNIDGGVLAPLLRISSEWKFACKDSQWLHLKEDKNLIASGKIWAGENYPSDQLLKLFAPSPEKRDVYEFPKGIIRMLERAAVFAGIGELESLSHVTLKRVGSELIISGTKENVGSIEEKLPWPEKAMPESFELIVTPKYLAKILAKSLEFSAGSKSIMFSFGNFQHTQVARKITADQTVPF